MVIMICMYVFMCVGVCECTCVYGGQRTTSGVAPQAHSTFYLRKGLSLTWHFTKQARLAGQQASGILLPSCHH